MAFINKNNILFSARVTGRRAIIHCETGLPTTDIDTTSFYEFEGSIYWYDGEWHRLGEGEGGGITAETDPTVHPWAKEPEKPTYTWNELLDKPFYVKGTVSETIDTRLSGGHRIEFNKESSDTWIAEQVSEKTYTKEQLLGGTVTSTWNTWTIDSSHIAEDTSDGLCLHFKGTIDGYVWIAYTTNYQPELFDAPLPAVGVYWSSYTSAGGEEMVSVHQIDLELEAIEHIDNKFLDLLNNRDFRTLKARVDVDATIIDVTSLPTENINEDVFYRLLTAKFLFGQFIKNDWTMYTVDTLPETGEMCWDGTAAIAYYSLADNNTYGYVNDVVSTAMGVPVGWYTADVLIPAVGESYGGIIYDITEAEDEIVYTYLSSVLCSYKNGVWTKLDIIGWRGTGENAEIFNSIKNVASGSSSHAEGYGTVASGQRSHAEGCATVASGSSSHAEGYGTVASGQCSHAEGCATVASGEDSHVEGYHTIAGSQDQHVQGKWNIEDTENKYAHIVGNGMQDSHRSNAHTLTWSGFAWYSGDVYVGGSSIEDENAQKLVTAKELEDVVDTIGDIETALDSIISTQNSYLGGTS